MKVLDGEGQRAWILFFGKSESMNSPEEILRKKKEKREINERLSTITLDLLEKYTNNIQIK